MIITRKEGQAGDVTEAAVEKLAENKVGSVVQLLVALVVAVVLGLAFILLRQPRKVGSPLSALVLDTMEDEWSRRLGAGTEQVREAVLRGGAGQLQDRLRELVGEVDIDFTFAGSAPVQILVRCSYADGNKTTATLSLPWENVPQEIRAEFLRSGDKEVHQRWTLSSVLAS